MSDIVIRKLNLAGEEIIRWSGRVIARTATSVTVEATFTRTDRLDLGYTVFERGDRFIEHFFNDRWYNIYEIHGVNTGACRGWYCNITRPALIEAAQVTQVDLALDVWVDADGRARVLDEDEFAALPLGEDEREAARHALAELLGLAAHRAGPFAARTNTSPEAG
jgi:protein associated with RNAse G/E